MQSSGSTPPAGGGTGSSGWQPPQDDGSQPIVAPVFIEKTAESSLFGSPTEAPVDMADLRIQEAMPVVLPHAEENTGALLVTTVTESPVEITTPTPVVSPEILPELTATNSLFSLDQKDAPSESGFLSDTRDIAEEKKVEKILHPKEFLERSIENIDSMIADIDTAYDQKVSEAE